MIKYRITRKELLQNKNICRTIGYCDAQFLLGYHSPIAYNSGTYGWNFDVYLINGYYITTGYRQMVGERAKNVKEYESKAEKIYYDRNISYEEKQDQIEKLLIEFTRQM